MPTFSIPLSGLTTESTALSAIANNLANLNTTGYKDSAVQFRDLFYQNLGTSGAGDPIQLGAGAGVAATSSLFTQGNVNPTGVATDVAISGDGFFVAQKDARRGSEGQERTLSREDAGDHLRKRHHQTRLNTGDDGFIDKLLYWRKGDSQKAVVDPALEAKRLQQNSALGQSPVTGDTPIIRDKKTGWFQSLFSWM